MESSSVDKQFLSLQQSFEALRRLSFPPSPLGCPSDLLPSGLFSKPLQRKVDALLRCSSNDAVSPMAVMQLTLSVAHRAVNDLIQHFQTQNHSTVNIWAAVRSHGCQFLGPAMQEDVLKLILLALEDGSCLSRKVLVLFVVQRLHLRYPQASKTAVGHVVQLLYRASCFNVIKRDEESSLMQLKEEFRNYESLRCQHDAQIVEISLEFGLRVLPEQWSCLLYGDTSHRSHMQSVADKLSKKRTFAQSMDDLLTVVKKSVKPSDVLMELKPHLDLLVSFHLNSTTASSAAWTDVHSSLDVVVRLLTLLTGLLQQRPVHRSDHVFVSKYSSRKCSDKINQTKNCETEDIDVSENNLQAFESSYDLNFVELPRDDNRKTTDLQGQTKARNFSDISPGTDKDLEHSDFLRSRDLAGDLGQPNGSNAHDDGTLCCFPSTCYADVFSNIAYSIAPLPGGISVPQMNFFPSSRSIPFGFYPQQPFLTLPVHVVSDAKVSTSMPNGGFCSLFPFHGIQSSACVQPLCYPAVDEINRSMSYQQSNHNKLTD